MRAALPPLSGCALAARLLKRASITSGPGGGPPSNSSISHQANLRAIVGAGGGRVCRRGLATNRWVLFARRRMASSKVLDEDLEEPRMLVSRLAEDLLALCADSR